MTFRGFLIGAVLAGGVLVPQPQQQQTLDPFKGVTTDGTIAPALFLDSRHGRAT